MILVTCDYYAESLKIWNKNIKSLVIKVIHNN